MSGPKICCFGNAYAIKFAHNLFWIRYPIVFKLKTLLNRMSKHQFRIKINSKRFHKKIQQWINMYIKKCVKTTKMYTTIKLQKSKILLALPMNVCVYMLYAVWYGYVHKKWEKIDWYEIVDGRRDSTKIRWIVRLVRLFCVVGWRVLDEVFVFLEITYAQWWRPCKSSSKWAFQRLEHRRWCCKSWLCSCWWPDLDRRRHLLMRKYVLRLSMMNNDSVGWHRSCSTRKPHRLHICCY